MKEVYNVYCDESCHLENDHQKVMVIGAVYCPVSSVKQISGRIREIKAKHGLKSGFEIKWTKVSPAKINFYSEIIDYFFDNDQLSFRAIIIPDKNQLQHHLFRQDHDTWYYKMYFTMLKAIFTPHDSYRIYVDIKDTRGGKKVSKLHDVLSNSMYDFSKKIIERIQIVKSEEIEIMQICDMLIGAVAYVNRNLKSSTAKEFLVKRIQKRSGGYTLTKSTLLKEKKTNIFVWSPQNFNGMEI